jgi:hypothetical protein
MEIGIPLDRYSYRARLLPALITFAPVALAYGVWSLQESALWKSVIVLLASLGFGMLLGQLGRDRGKNREFWLFNLWGGKPTTRLLSHRLTRLNAATLHRYYEKLKSLLPDIRVPDSAEEMRSPDDALQKYDSCILFLREKTRDSKAFPLVFAENVNYGFRRNLWAWKPFGISASCLGILAGVLFVAVRSKSSSPDERLFATIAIATSVVLLVLWTFVIKPAWVRTPAESYADRLVGSLDNL